MLHARIRCCIEDGLLDMQDNHVCRASQPCLGGGGQGAGRGLQVLHTGMLNTHVLCRLLHPGGKLCLVGLTNGDTPLSKLASGMLLTCVLLTCVLL